MLNRLSVIILTFNEELNLPKCLENLQGLDADIYVIDSYSTDLTKSIAEQFKATFIQHKFETHAKQWQFALSIPEIKSEWILGLDADQELGAELRDEIKALLQNNPKENGFYICRRNYFLNKWIKYGGYYPRYLLKLFRKEFVYLDEHELMDHHFYVNGSTAKLKFDLTEHNLNETLSFWIAKHNQYATLQAQEEVNANISIKGKIFGSQDERRLYFKKLWNQSPLFIRPCIYFIYRYFIQLGFLDGKKGLIFHFLQGFWFRFLVDAKIFELKKRKEEKAGDLE
jgi:glycosyltransferase involved in cell wall biosynthesis